MLILVMGGSCFVGRELVEALVAPRAFEKLGLGKENPVTIAVLNRGRRYWELATGAARSDLPKGVLRVTCDRMDNGQLSAKIEELLAAVRPRDFDRSPGREADARGGALGKRGGAPQGGGVIVVDFCAYKPKHIRPLVCQDANASMSSRAMGMTLQTGSAPSASNTTPRQFYGSSSSSSSVKQGDEHEAKEDKQESNLEKGEGKQQGRAPPSSSPRSLSSTARGDAHSGSSRSNSYRKRPLKESDAIRPESRKEQKMLKREDSYGHKKLRCEEYLEKKSREMGFSYAALRLCDVIGPYDNTDRFWY
eukprot:jgi/Bigna1/79117/fgenesh1_pg.59_\